MVPLPRHLPLVSERVRSDLGRRLIAHIDRQVSKSIATNHACAEAHEVFATFVFWQLPPDARDQYLAVGQCSAPRRPAAIRAWARRWGVDTYGIRVWATEEMAEWETSGLDRTIATARGWARGNWLLDP